MFNLYPNNIDTVLHNTKSIALSNTWVKKLFDLSQSGKNYIILNKNHALPMDIKLGIIHSFNRQLGNTNGTEANTTKNSRLTH